MPGSEGREMSPRYRHDDPNQLHMEFCERIETFAEVTREILDHANAAVKALECTEGIETEDELHVEIAAACKQAIRESGMTRDQVLDGINRYLGRTEDGETPDRKKKYSIHMLNNWLSKPSDNRLPTRVLHAIVKITGSLVPYEVLVADAGGVVISSAERTELQLGKLEQLIREAASMKRQLMRSKGR